MLKKKKEIELQFCSHSWWTLQLCLSTFRRGLRQQMAWQSMGGSFGAQALRFHPTRDFQGRRTGLMGRGHHRTEEPSNGRHLTLACLHRVCRLFLGDLPLTVPRGTCAEQGGWLLCLPRSLRGGGPCGGHAALKVPREHLLDQR